VGNCRILGSRRQRNIGLLRLALALINKVRDNKNYLFWLGVVLCTIYQSYRYPLQVSSSGTSPTYSDTPLALQAGKFVLALPLIMFSAVRWLWNSARLPRLPIVLGTVSLAVYSLLKIYEGHDSQFLDLSFWMVFALILVLAADSVSVAAIDKYLGLLLVYALASTGIEVFLFVAFGRQTALSGTFLVRFGGFLDDPNGFAAILFLLMGWSYQRFRGRNCFLALTGLVVSLLLTQSWTAFAFFLAFLFFFVVIFLLKRPVTGVMTICALPVFAVVVVEWIRQLPTDLLWQVLQDKQSSIEGHTFPWARWISKWPDWLVMGDWKYNPYESWWASSMVNFGLVWFGAYLTLIIALLFFLWRAPARATPQAKPVYTGLLFFGSYFAFGSLNLPFPIIFPINALFFLFFFLAAFGKIAPENNSIPSSCKIRTIGTVAKPTR
jgi:hypothetical protein